MIYVGQIDDVGPMPHDYDYDSMTMRNGISQLTILTHPIKSIF